MYLPEEEREARVKVRVRVRVRVHLPEEAREAIHRIEGQLG